MVVVVVVVDGKGSPERRGTGRGLAGRWGGELWELRRCVQERDEKGDDTALQRVMALLDGG